MAPTRKFVEWLSDLADLQAVARITARLQRVEAGHLGCGPGYRVSFARRRKSVIFLLCAGDKSTQYRDIATAQRMAKEMGHDQ